MAKSKKQEVEETQTAPVAAQESVAQAPAVKSSNTPVTQAEDLAAWGSSNVSAQDIIIPRILLMQPMSEKVTAGDAKFGEFRESLSNELLGNFEQPFEVVPFHMEKVFVEFDASQDEKEFIRVVPITPENENLPYEDTGLNKKGEKVPISRDRTMNFYVLLPKELELGGAIPYILSMRRTSLQAGKKLATQMFVKNVAARRPPPAVTMQISAGKQTEDKKTWAVMDVKPVSATKPEWMVEAFSWLQLIKAGKAKAHEESYNEDAKVAADVPASGASVDNGPARF